MNRGELRRQWRLRVSDTKTPYLWVDIEFDAFLDEAVLEAARRAHLLVDSTSSVAQAQVTANEVFVPLDPRVIFIRRARLQNQAVMLSPRSTLDMDESLPGWEASTASRPLVFVPDWQTGGVALWPPSKIDDLLVGTFVREPMEAMISDEDAPEISARFHLSLLDWVSYRAYSRPDTDTYDEQAAMKALARFEGEFGPRAAAINEAFSFGSYYAVGDFQ